MPPFLSPHKKHIQYNVNSSQIVILKLYPERVTERSFYHEKILINHSCHSFSYECANRVCRKNNPTKQDNALNTTATDPETAPVSESSNSPSVSNTSAAYEKLIAYKTDNYSQQSVADFNNLLLDNNDFLELLEAHSDVMAAISPNDDNYDFIMLTLNASLNEIYYEQVEKNTVFSLSGYLEKKEQPMNVEPLPDKTSLSAEEQSYNFLFYALYSINYTLPDPAAITVAERDSILKAFRAKMQQYVDGLSVNEIVDSNIKTLLSDKATELANSMSSEKISLSYEISSIEIHNAGTEITQ